MNLSRVGTGAAGLALWLLATTLHGANWPQWRGPAFNGSSTESGLPSTFSVTENVKWSAALPGPAAATPVTWNRHVFVSSTDREAQVLVAMALDRESGKIRWQHQVSEGVRRDNRSDFAGPSPVTDGKRAIFYYGNGELVAYDFDGNRVWRRNIQTDEGEFATLWTYSTSPLLHGGNLYIQVLQRDTAVSGRGRPDGRNRSYLLALDPATGGTLWKRTRPSQANAESLEAFTTPVPVEAASGAEILVAGGDCLTGHDPKSGVELWRWGTYNPTRIGHWRLVPSPVAVEDVAVLCAPKGAPVYAIKLGGRGSLGAAGVAWQSPDRRVTSDVATPLFYQGRLYVLNGEKKILARVDPTTGEPDWVGELGTRAKIESSPTGGDGKIYFMDHSGTVFVVSAGEEFRILNKVVMGDPSDRDSRSSVVISHGNLLIRTAARLYCIGD